MNNMVEQETHQEMR